MKTATQMRMARAALGWAQADLADKCELSVLTIKRMELNGFDNVKAVTIKTVQDALEKAGVRFTNQGCVCPPDTKRLK